MADFNTFVKYFYFKKKKARIVDHVFSLHTQVTSGILHFCAFMLTLKQYFGEPINCSFTAKAVSQKVMDAFCWLNVGSYIMANQDGKLIGAHPGVMTNDEVTDEKRRYQSYYQWIALLLFGQALLFYLPRFIWKFKEQEWMTKVIKHIDDPLNVEKEETLEKKKRAVAEMFVQRLKGKINDDYARWFLFCEVFNLLNIIFLFFFMDALLDNSFFSYGIKILGSSETDEMDRIFPKITKCVFSTYGPAGSVVPYDSICVLSINILNEKIFFFLWFWFVFMLTISLGNLFYRLLTYLNIGNIRYNSLLRMQAYILDPHLVYKLNQKLKFGDWFMLTLLRANIDALMFCELTELIDCRLKGEDISYKPKTVEESCDAKLKAIKSV